MWPVDPYHRAAADTQTKVAIQDEPKLRKEERQFDDYNEEGEEGNSIKFVSILNEV